MSVLTETQQALSFEENKAQELSQEIANITNDLAHTHDNLFWICSVCSTENKQENAVCETCLTAPDEEALFEMNKEVNKIDAQLNQELAIKTNELTGINQNIKRLAQKIRIIQAQENLQKRLNVFYALILSIANITISLSILALVYAVFSNTGEGVGLSLISTLIGHRFSVFSANLGRLSAVVPVKLAGIFSRIGLFFSNAFSGSLMQKIFPSI